MNILMTPDNANNIVFVNKFPYHSDCFVSPMVIDEKLGIFARRKGSWFTELDYIELVITVNPGLTIECFCDALLSMIHDDTLGISESNGILTLKHDIEVPWCKIMLYPQCHGLHTGWNDYRHTGDVYDLEILSLAEKYTLSFFTWDSSGSFEYAGDDVKGEYCLSIDKHLCLYPSAQNDSIIEKLHLDWKEIEHHEAPWL